MVLSSVQVRMDSSDWPQSVMHNRALKPTMMEQGLKPPPDQALKCPRCDSSNTKFCYYNNYSLSQPRHFCKTCKRYWTKGGTLRNVPVGGGCRKNKRAKRTMDQAAAPHHGPINEASTSAAAPGNELNSCPPLGNTHGQLIPGVSSANMYYALPSNSTNGNISLAFAAARLGDQRALSHCNTNTNNSTNNNSSEFLRMSCGTQSASFDIPHGSLSGLSSLSTLSALNMARLSSLKPNFSCLSFCGSGGTDHGNHGVGSDLSTFFESYPTQIPEASPVLNAHSSEGLSAPFSLSLDNNSNSDIHWRSQQQKLHNIALKAEGRAGDHDHAAAQALLPFEDHNNININMNSTGNDQKIVTSIMPSYSIKVEEENRLGSEWQVPSDQTLFEAAGDSTSLYWNGGAWPDLAIYGSSVSPLI